MSIRPLTPELAELAHKKYQETPEKLQEALQQIKDWLALQSHIHARTDDQWLAAYIRGCQFKLEKVKSKLDLFYTCRQTASDYYQLHHKDEKFKELLGNGFYLPLPRLSDPTAPRVTLIRTRAYDVVQNGAVNALAIAHVIDKILMVDDDNAIISGNVVVVDFKDTNFLHMLSLSPTQLKMLIASQQDAVPFVSSISFFINIPEGFNVFLNMMKNLLDDTNKGQVFIYNEDFEEMYTKPGISKEVMPEEYGGNGGTVREITDHWLQKVEEYSDWLEEDLQFGTDESKRPGRPRTAQDMFGDSLPIYENFFQNL